MEWVFCACIGLVSGFLGGLLGIRGGIVIVPALLFCLPRLGIEGPDLTQVAVARSLAIVVPPSISSAPAPPLRRPLDLPGRGPPAPPRPVRAPPPPLAGPPP